MMLQHTICILLDHERMGLVEMAQLASPSITSQAPNIKQAAAPNQLAPND
jgi:hypothetical protein